MKILEARDGFIKLETEKELLLTSFLHIKDDLRDYVAQIVQTKQSGAKHIAYAKLVYLYNESLNSYDGTLPSLDSEVSEFDFELFNKSIETNNPIAIGDFASNNQDILVDTNILNKELLISVDDNVKKEIIISNITNQLENSIIIDMSGKIGTNKTVAGTDFKLPLNTDALKFIFEDCLNDATSDSKDLIKEIFRDLSDYSKTVPFLPFMVLKGIVDDMVEKSHIFKLLVLKNKLAKFEKLGYFATSVSEVDNLNKAISSKNTVIDLSKLDNIFQNRYLNIILSTIENLEIKPFIFVEATNSIDKKNLKKIITGTLPTTLIINSRFKYINDIKSMFANYIIEPNFINNNVFKTYATLLNSAPNNSYLVVGKNTNFIPLISSTNKRIIEKESEIIDGTENDNNSVFSEKDFEEEFKEPSIKAIEKKSDEIIEKISEEIKTNDVESPMEIFDEEEPSEEDIDTTEFDDSNTIIDEFSAETNDTDIIDSSIEDSEDYSELESIAIEDNEEINIESDESSEKTYNIEEVVVEQEQEQETDDIIDNSDSDILINTSEEELILLEDEVIEETLELELEEDTENITSDEHIEKTEYETIELAENEITLKDDTSEEIQFVEFEENVTEETIPEISDEITNETYENVEVAEDNKTPSYEVLPIDENVYDEIDDIVELDESEFNENDIIVEMGDDEEDLDKAIVEDVDKVFTTIKDETITDSDLDFIDELNNNVNNDIVLTEGMEELTEISDSEEIDDNNILEPLEEINDYSEIEEENNISVLETKNISTPIVPVYSAEIPNEDTVISDNIEQGDSVVHSKYGNGIVEKMIKYGNKTLYSINFDNVGRRLLDPTITEIKKS